MGRVQYKMKNYVDIINLKDEEFENIITNQNLMNFRNKRINGIDK